MRFPLLDNQMAIPGMTPDWARLSQMSQQPVQPYGGMTQPNQPMQTNFGVMQNPGNMPAPGSLMRQPNQPMNTQFGNMQTNFGNMTPKPYVPPGGPVTSVNPGMQNLPQTGMLSNPAYGTMGPAGMLAPQSMGLRQLMSNPAEIQRRQQYYAGL